MSYVVDPNLEKAQILVNFAKKQELSLKPKVLEIIKEVGESKRRPLDLTHGPFQSSPQAQTAVVEAGKAVSGLKLAGTVFGNVSTIFDDIIYISTTGSNLNSLDNSIACCDSAGNILNNLKPSSEFPSHFRIYKETRSKCILHAHPFFTVVYTMLKGEGNTMFGVPIVGGEVGGGENGIVHTVPPVLKDFNIVAVHAHGVFAVDAFDFNAPLKNISKLEQLCKKRYIEKYL
jgi:ribulose-5-phosphate 4-epimerase/fuculose-1-phosphate aldolase